MELLREIFPGVLGSDRVGIIPDCTVPGAHRRAIVALGEYFLPDILDPDLGAFPEISL